MEKFWQRFVEEGGPQPAAANPTQADSLTLARVEALMQPAGITRLANITGLDVIGIPVFQAIRPYSRNITVSAGKGPDLTSAKLSTLMECLEGFHAERIDVLGQQASIRQIGPLLGYDPHQLSLSGNISANTRGRKKYNLFELTTGGPPMLKDQAPVSWIEATELAGGRRSWVPKALCSMDFTVSDTWAIPFFKASSNGLAAGSSITDALVHGLCEVIERDASIRNPHAWKDPSACIDPETIRSESVLALLDKFRRGRVKVQLVSISHATGLPCCEAYIWSAGLPVFKGAASHPSRETALLKAILEAAQSRLSFIAGSRDDLYRELYLYREDRQAGKVFLTPAKGDFRDIPECPPGSGKALVSCLVNRIAACTGAVPLAVDLQKPEFGLPVVFVIAPGMKFCHPARRVNAFRKPSRSHTPLRQASPAKPRIYFFSGPTLSSGELEKICACLDAAVYLAPPIQQGDLLRLADDPPDAVCIIDGNFHQSPSVLHKEILLMISKGVTVWGASSMGALRAAELCTCGMIGVGRIFNSFRKGILENDDEVAVLHGDEESGYRQLTEPLVNMRYVIARACKKGLISQRTARVLTQLARGLHYSQRTYHRLSQAADGKVPGQEWKAFIRFQETNRPDLKKMDAFALVDEVVSRFSGTGASAPGRDATPLPEPKYFYRQKLDYAGHTVRGCHIPESLALSFWKLHAPDFPFFYKKILYRTLYTMEDAASQHLCGEELVRSFMLEEQLATEAELQHWLREHYMNHAELILNLKERKVAERFMQQEQGSSSFCSDNQIKEASIRKLVKKTGVFRKDLVSFLFSTAGIPLEQPLVREMKHCGAYGQALDLVYRVLANMNQFFRSFPSTRLTVTEQKLDNWACSFWQIRPSELRREMKARGFTSSWEFYEVAQYFYLEQLTKRLYAIYGAGKNHVIEQVPQVDLSGIHQS